MSSVQLSWAALEVKLYVSLSVGQPFWKRDRYKSSRLTIDIHSNNCDISGFRYHNISSDSINSINSIDCS